MNERPTISTSWAASCASRYGRRLAYALIRFQKKDRIGAARWLKLAHLPAQDLGLIKTLKEDWRDLKALGR